MRHVRQMSAADVRAAADRAAAGSRPPALPVDAVRRAADRAEERGRPKPASKPARFSTMGDDFDDIPF